MYGPTTEQFFTMILFLIFLGMGSCEAFHVVARHVHVSVSVTRTPAPAAKIDDAITEGR